MRKELTAKLSVVIHHVLHCLGFSNVIVLGNFQGELIIMAAARDEAATAEKERLLQEIKNGLDRLGIPDERTFNQKDGGPFHDGT